MRADFRFEDGDCGEWCELNMCMPIRVWRNKRVINLRACAPLRETKNPVFEYLTQRRKENTTVGAPPHRQPPRTPPRRSSIHHRRTRKHPHPPPPAQHPTPPRLRRVLEPEQLYNLPAHRPLSCNAQPHSPITKPHPSHP